MTISSLLFVRFLWLSAILLILSSLEQKHQRFFQYTTKKPKSSRLKIFDHGRTESKWIIVTHCTCTAVVYFTPRPKWLSAWISSSLTLVIHLPGMNDIESTAISPSNDGPRIPSMEICNENNPTLMSQKAVGLFEWKVRAFLDQILLFCKAHLIKCPK